MPSTAAVAEIAPTPRAVALRPGLPVLKRDEHTLQVGLRPPLTIRLPRHPDVDALLRALRHGTSTLPRSAPASAALRTLRRAGLLCEPGSAPGPARAQFGEDAVRRARVRADHRVGLWADPPAEALLSGLLADADLARSDDRPTVRLIVTTGPIPRERVDPLQRSGVPHLLVTASAGGWRLGPFVEPGRGACLRCVDAHEADQDPRLPLLIEQAARQECDQPIDPLLERFALSWAVRDLTRWAEGDEPSTWSATVDIGPVAAPEVTPRLRHPHCGCAWDAMVGLV